MSVRELYVGRLMVNISKINESPLPEQLEEEVSVDGAKH